MVAVNRTKVTGPDGQVVTSSSYMQEPASWKRYRGGWSPDIFIFDLEKLTRLWPAVLDELRQGSAMLSALYEGARPLALEGGGNPAISAMVES